MDTIYALATARGRAGVAIIRVSGPSAWSAAETLCGVLPKPRHAALRRIMWQDEVLDEALILCFSADGSFTGEPVVEFQLHGSPAIMTAVLKALSQQEGLRPAEAGEFTRRALENGRLDLAQVEGLSDLLEAETDAQRRQAMRVFSGAVGQRAEDWRRRLIRAVALLEATIDFVEEDVPVDVAPEVVDLLRSVEVELVKGSKGVAISERLRDGFEVAIVGRPNTGKSTLLNYLAGREAAITSEIAGTTRDVIEVRMDLSGLPVTILDTAGLRETADPVEEIGITRALARAEAADLRVFLLDDQGLPAGVAQREDDIMVSGKADLTGAGISGRTGEGVSALVGKIEAILSRRLANAAIITRERHRLAILRSLDHIAAASGLVQGAGPVDLAAEELHSAIRSLNGLVGRVDVEHILDEIFSTFCIGK